MKRFATANWQGTGKDGNGNLTSQSMVLNKTQYNYSSRFNEGAGTNPEELIAAAHAGCFTMKLSFLLTDAGFPPENIDTRCDITLNAEEGVISLSHLSVTASVPNISKEIFDQLIVNAKENCPVSKLINAAVTYEAILEHIR